MRHFIIFVALVAASSATDILESPQITDFGRWGHFDNCTDGLLVTGFQLKVEAYRRRLDNTALNAIKLFCGNADNPSMQEISSTRGPFGRYQIEQYCSSYANGFQLMSQSYQGRNRDDVAAVNFKLICADGEQLEDYREPSGHDYPESRYTETRYCPSGQGICGIQTQVESRRGLGDDTALNNVRVKCCEVLFGEIVSTSQHPEELESTTLDAVQETEPVQEITDATTEIETSNTETDLTTAVSNDVTPEFVATDATTVVAEYVTPSEIIDVTPEVVTDATTELVNEVTPEVVTEATTDLANDITDATTITVEDVTPELGSDATTELVNEVTPELVTDATTELVNEVTPEVVTDATTELVNEVTPEVVTDATIELVNEVTPEVVTDATTELVNEVTPEVVTDATTELISDVTPEVVDATTEVIPEAPTELNPEQSTSDPSNLHAYYGWLLNNHS